MIRKHTRITLAGAAALTMSSLLLAAPSWADTPAPPSPDYFIEWSLEHGVDVATIEDLVATLEAGEILDSMKADSVPVSVIEQETSDGLETVSTFADGSISVSVVELPSRAAKGGATPKAISGCTSFNGAGYAAYSNCRIYYATGTLTIEFYSNYTRTATAGSVSNWRDEGVTAHYGSATMPTLSSARSTSSGANPAVVTAHSYFTSYNGAASEDIYLSLRVSPSQAWTTQY